MLYMRLLVLLRCHNFTHITSLTQSYITTGLSYASGVEYASGGYIRVGNIIIVNIRVFIASDIPASTHIIKGFPLPDVSLQTITVTNNKAKPSYVEYATGNMYCDSPLTSNSVFVAGCVYIAK